MALMVSARSTKGNGELHVGDAHQHGLRPPAEEAGDEAEQPADHRGQQHRAEADEERDAGAVEHARVEVAPELVRAEDVAGRARRLEARHEIALDRVVRRDQGRGEGGDQGHRRQEEAEDAERVALESADHAVSASRRGPRVQPAVEQVHPEVDERVGDGDQEHRGEHHGKVPVQERLHREPADSGPGEDGLGDDGPAEELTRLEPGQRDDGDRRVLERVLGDDHPLGQALGARGEDVFLPQRLEHGRSA
jgi:hypothetical protein